MKENQKKSGNQFRETVVMVTYGCLKLAISQVAMNLPAQNTGIVSSVLTKAFSSNFGAF